MDGKLVMNGADTFTRLDAKRREQTPQALARLVIVSLFVSLWVIFWVARVPMPLPFLIALLLEIAFFVVYWRVVFILPNVRAVSLAQYVMLAAEILFHTTMVYFLGGLSWLGAFAYVFGLIFTNAFLDLRKGMVYTTGACAAFSALILLEATGVVPHYDYLAQGPLRYSDPRFVTTTLVCAVGVFYSIYLWSSWVGAQLRRERDAAIRAQDQLLDTRVELQRANEELEQRVRARTVELEMANAALQDSEHRVRTVITNAPVVLFALDNNGAFTLLEGKALETLDVDPEQVVGRSAFDVYTNAPAVIDAINRALDGERTTVLAPGGALLFEAQLEPLHDDRGNIIGVIGVATDITERMRAEDALRESEERFRKVFEEGPLGMAIVGRDVKPLRANAALCRMLGYTEKELLEKSFTEITHPNYRDRDSALAVRLFAGEISSFKVEKVYVKKSGESLPIMLAATALRDAEGNITYSLGMMEDISERKRAEEALSESEEQFRAFAENAVDGVIMVNGDGYIAMVNGAAERMLGYAREELLGQTVDKLVPQPSQQAHHEHRASFFAHARPRPMAASANLRARRKDGGEFPVDISLTPLRTGTDPLVAVTIRDITERKHAEEALRESEETLKSTIESTADGILVVNNAGQVVYANQRFADMWRIPGELLETRDDDRLLEYVLSQLQEPELFLAKVKELYQSSREDLDTLDFIDGRAFERYSRPLLMGDLVAGRVWSFRDVSERKRNERTLAEQARRDPLTGLLNRRAGLSAIEERIAVAGREQGCLAVFVLDLDKFKSINDNYSHEMGDAALVRLSAVLTKLVGERGVICRLGGDEFEIAIDAIDLEEGVGFGEQLLRALHDSLASDQSERLPMFTASVGVVGYPEDGESAVELGHRADEAMYAGKAAGGDTVRTWRYLSRERAA